ncbi:MAG: porin family protein [Cyclobacteriaceae bacterium]|jgi:hypothetical protein
MKKRLLFFVSILFITSITAFSQSFGLKGGLNVSNVVGDSKGVSSRTSFHVGLFYLAPLSESVKIMPELIYSSQGASAGTTSVTYNYLNLPVMLNFHTSEKFFFQAGPQLGVLTSADLSNGTASVSVKDQLKDIDFALCFGLGGEFSKMIINARYNLGLTSTSKATNGSFPNSVIQFSVGFKFN